MTTAPTPTSSLLLLVALKRAFVQGASSVKRRFSLAGVQSDVLLLSRMHVTAFSIDQQPGRWCFVVRWPMCSNLRLPRTKVFCTRVPALIPKFGSQPGLGVYPFNSYKLLITTLSSTLNTIASFPSLLFRSNKVNISEKTSGGSGVFILGATGVATLSYGGHTTNTFALNYRVCNRLYQIINT